VSTQADPADPAAEPALTATQAEPGRQAGPGTAVAAAGEARTAAAITTAGLTLGFGKRDVLSNMSTDIRSGVVTAILGPTGSGKSTLLRKYLGPVDFQALPASVVPKPDALIAKIGS
jgi:ABC-type multidrug transport system fused ATPase/permease subunit